MATALTPVLERLLGSRLVAGAPAVTGEGVVFRRLDATLGHDGLPQSATGQTAILTGLNAAELMNGHYGPWPGPTLRRALDSGTLFHLGRDNGGAQLANAYPPGYFAAMSGRRYRPNANVYAARAAGLELKGSGDYLAGRGVASDLEGRPFAAAPGGGGPVAAARALTALAAGNAFTLLDVWLTDHFGHRQDMAAARALLERVDALLGALLDGPDGLTAGGGTLVMTSDHGNVEDLSRTSHTRNEVPLLAVGPGAGAFASATSLLDLAPAAAAVMAGRPERA